MDRLPPLLTIGHSTRPLPGLIALLARHGVRSLADVRAFPGSRANPQYRRESLEPALAAAGIRYEWIPALGGRRPRPPGPPRLGGWSEPGFQGYEAHMSTDEFASGLARLLALARETAPDRTAFMCSEARWWSCHRAMIADALAARGLAVRHIMDADLVAHPLDARRDRYAPGTLPAPGGR
ncbi:MAG TPA: DUF488 domain-containing protein [Thermodesulfobacteriota bacterium]